MKYNQNEYSEQSFSMPQKKRLTKRVKVTCSHCHHIFFTNEATFYYWIDRKELPLQGMVVNCNHCGCRNLLPQIKSKPKINLVLLPACILVFLLIGGFALKNIFSAPQEVGVHTSAITDISDNLEDVKEENLDSLDTEQSDKIEEKSENFANVENAVYELRRESGVAGTLKKGDVADKVSTVFGNSNYRREDITRIEFLNSADARSADAWDISADGNGGIYAWVDQYDCLHIASNGEIKLSGDCTGLFAYFTNVREIAFNGCLNTEDVTDMSLLFYHCENLQSIDFEGFDTSSAISMDRMFTGCESILALDLSGFDTGNVTDMYGMFAHCKQLVSLNVSSFDTSNVSNMEHIFQGCETIQKLDIRSFNTSKVKSGDSMFYQCYDLQSLLFDVEQFDTGNMTSMYAMFARCDNLRSLDVSHFDTRKVTNMAYMFNKDAYLTELAYDKFDMSNVTEKANMLNGTIWQE